MRKIQVKVRNTSQPRKREGRATKAVTATKARFKAIIMRPRLLIAAGLIGFVAFIGTPHVGWDYECAHQMQGIGTCRSASWCAYYGIQGRRIDWPASGETCDLVRFLTIDWGRLWDVLSNG